MAQEYNSDNRENPKMGKIENGKIGGQHEDT
jgi:hypothetical protein